MHDKKIIFCLRRDFVKSPGGDTAQMESWAKVLRKCGNTVTLHSGAVRPGELAGCDLVFLWHLERLHESYQPWMIAKKLGIPVVLSPTCWHEQKSGLYRSCVEQVKLLLRMLRTYNDPALHAILFRSWSGCRKALLSGTTLFAVNSIAEKKLILQDGAAETGITVIPNVINEKDLDGIADLPWEQRKRVVCVGHFCPRKNQLGLIRALKNTGVRVTFVGAARPMHKLYFKQCLHESGGQHEFAGALPHRATLELMAQSRISICASLSETPGICNLEAAALGCSLVLPEIAPVREYFRKLGTYIMPKSIDAVLIKRAMQEPPSADLRNFILENYTEKNLEKIFDQLLIPEVTC